MLFNICSCFYYWILICCFISSSDLFLPPTLTLVFICGTGTICCYSSYCSKNCPSSLVITNNFWGVASFLMSHKFVHLNLLPTYDHVFQAWYDSTNSCPWLTKLPDLSSRCRIPDRSHLQTYGDLYSMTYVCIYYFFYILISKEFYVNANSHRVNIVFTLGSCI